MAGNTGPIAATDASTTITIDTTAPTITSFSTTTADGFYKAGSTIDITATASEAIRSGNSINVVLNAGTGANLTLTASSAGTTLTGTYTVAAGQTSADLTVSSFTIVSVQDTAGNAMTSVVLPTGTNNIGGAKAIVIDTTSPAAPTAVDLSTSSDTGTSASNNITGDNTPNINLVTLETNATVVITATKGADSITCQFVASTTTGNCDLPTLSDGTWSITATQTDPAGNVSASATALSVVVDTTGPAAPSNLVATAGSASVTISFDAGVGGPAPVTNYKYSLNGGAFTALSPADTDSPITISGLTNDTTYTITLKTVTDMGDSATSASVSATPSRIFNLGNVSYTEQASAVDLAPNVSFAGGTSYDGKYIDFAITSGKTVESLGFRTVATATTTSGVVSIVGTSVYLGNGTTADPIGSIDSTRNGQSGQPLRINFTSSFSNSSFESGDISGWTYLDQQVDLGVTSIAGFRTTDTSTYPNNCAAGASANDHAVTGITADAFDYSIITSTIGGSPGVTDGTKALRLFSSMTKSPGGFIAHGPAIYSDIFPASQGDTIYFDWKAADGGDNYHVFGYILNTATGAQTEVLDSTGSVTNWATKATTIPASGNYRFVFVSGTHDYSCGGVAGASLYVDNVRVFGSKVNDEVAAKVARLVTYANGADNPDASRTVTLSTNPTGGSVSKTFNVAITAVDDAPSLIAVSTSYTNAESTSESFTAKSGTLAGSDPDGDVLTYSLPDGTAGTATFGAVTYNQYVTGTYGTLWLETSTGRYYHAPNNTAINARLTNDQESFSVRTTASGVEATSTFTLSIAITAAAPAAPTGLIVEPGVRAASLSWTAPTWIGGSAVTGYKIDHSTNGTAWTTFSDNSSTTTSIRVTGLADNTAYFFRVAAKNANGTSAVVSTSPTTYTTFNIPTALSLTPVGGTVVANTINSTTTNLTASVNIVAGRVAGGTATLYLAGTAIATDTSISSSDTLVEFDLGTSTNTALRAIVGSGGAMTVKIVDAFGLESLGSTAVTLSTDYVAPNVTGVSVSSNPGADKTYVAGNTITFSVTTSEAVTVSGTPTLPFLVGSATRTATYTSGSGTSTLSFSYTVSAGDDDSDGISVPSDSLTIGGGIRDAAGNLTMITHDAVAASSNHLVDTTTPTVASVAVVSNAGADSRYKAGDTIDVRVTMSEIATVSGIPKINVTVGSSTKSASYVSGTGSTELLFRYTVASGDTDTDGASIAADAITVTGASITDVGGNIATLTHAVLADDSDHLVDTTAPMVTLSAAVATSTSTTLTFTVSSTEQIDCDTITSADFTITLGSLTSVESGWDTSCSLTVTSSLTTGEKATSVVAKASSGFGIADIAGNIQVVSLTGTGASTYVDLGTGAAPAYPAASATSVSVTALLNEPTEIGSGWDISDPTNVDWSLVRATVTTDRGSLSAAPGDSGATVSTSSNTVTIVGSMEQVEAALNATGTGYVRVTHTSTSSATLSVKIEPNTTFQSGARTYAFNPANGRYYTLDTTVRSWVDSSLAARSMSFAGAGGYLTAVGTQSEDTFVRQTVLSAATGSFFTSGVRCATATAGKVCTGMPGTTSGALYWSPGANAPDAESGAVSPSWSPWHTGEPNQLTTSANVPYLTYWNNGSTWGWDDFTAATPLGGIVEFGNNASYSPVTLTRSIDFVIGTADRVDLRRSAVGTASGVVFSTQPAVHVTDRVGNTVVTDNSSIIVASVSSGATLVGTTSATAVNGVATFTNLGISGTAGTVYTVTFAVDQLLVDTQDIQVSHGPAAKLRVATQPIGSTAGAVFATTPVVEVLDATDNVVLDSSASVAVTSSGGQLGGVQSVNATAGVALFPGLTFAGTANQTYTLSFASGQLAETTSSTFSVEVGAPTNLVIRSQADGAKYGMAFESQPDVEVRDAGANLVTTSSLPVTLAVSSGTTVGTVTVDAENGVATFSDAGIRTSPGTYTLTYSSGALATAQQSITVVRAPRTISFSTTSFAKTYGDDTFTVSAAASLGTTDGAVTYTATGIACSVGSSTGVVTITGAGSCAIEATAAQGTNYLAATTASNVAVSIAKKSLVITASSHDLVYGDPTPVVTPSYDGFVYGESASALLTPPTCTTPYTPTSTALVDLESTCTGTTSNNYDISYTPGTITIAKQPTTVNFNASSLSQVFNGDPRAVATTTTPSNKKLVMRYVGPQHDSANPPVNAGSYTVTATVEETNFVGTATATLVITAAQQATITLVNPPETTYGASLQLVATGGSGSGALTYRVASGSCTLSAAGLLSAPGAGTCSVTASRASSNNYLAATSAAQTVSIAKAAQTIAFTSAVPGSPAPDTTYTPTATASSGLAASLSISAGENTVCSIANGTVRFLANGTCEITATQAGNANYAAATSVKQTIAVGRLNQTISFTQPAPVTLGDPAFMLEASASSGLGVTYTVTAGSTVCLVTATGMVSILAPGTCDITVSQAGDSVYSSASPVTKSIVVRAGLPGIPHLMAVGAGDSKLTVSFSAPPTDGGSPILAYIVTATDQSGNAYTKSDCDTTSLACTIEGLTNGTTYTTTVAAVTAAGTGSPSRVSDPLAPFIAPQAPREITGSRSDTTLDVSWDEPEDLGGGTLVRYDVSIRPKDGSYGDAVQVTPSSARPSDIVVRSTPRRFNHTFRSLRNGVTYEIRVVTITTLSSSASQNNTAQAVALPMITPDPVRDLQLESVDGVSAVATWATPLRDGGSPLTRYNITTNNGTCSLSSALATKCEITGLTSGTSLSVTVRAVTTLGTSDPETVTLSLPDKPNAPTLNEVTRSGTAAEVAWTPPTATGGKPITSYRAVAVSTLDPTDVQRCSSAGTTCTIRNLTPTSAYTFTVRATNGVGTSAPSGSITVGGTSAIPSAWGTPSFGMATARRVLALPPGPQAVKVRAAGTRNRTNVTAVAPQTNVAISHAIITVAGVKGRIIARIKVAVDREDPTASVTIPYASSKVRIGVQFANDYGISKLSAKSFFMPKFVTSRTDAAANVLPGKPGADVQAKRMGKSIYFLGASAQLDATDKAELRRIAAQIKREGGLVWVTGWARRSPTTSNAFMKKVSEQRAIAVAHYLATLGIQQWIRFDGAGTPTSTTGVDTDRRVDVAVSPLD